MEQDKQIELWATLTEARLRALLMDFKTMTMVGHEIARAVNNSPIPARSITRDVLYSILDAIQQEMIDFEFTAAYPPDEIEPEFIIETLAKQCIADNPSVTKSTNPFMFRQIVEKWILRHATELPWYKDYSKDYVTHLTYAVQLILENRVDEHSPEVA
jgi:hypothetical protein